MYYNNVLYFNNDIDIRLCTKNGSSTLTSAWSAIYNKPTTQLDLLCRCMKNQDLFNPPFRPGSYRIAIKRDPIERFLSAAFMIKLKTWPKKPYENWNDILKDLIYNTWSLKSDETWNDILKDLISNTWSQRSYETQHDNLKNLIDLHNFDKTIENLESNKIKDDHFFSQTLQMGHVNEYDKIYYVHELPTLLQWLKTKCKTQAKITTLWSNRNEIDYKNILLSDQQKLRIMKLYADDYANGWC